MCAESFNLKSGLLDFCSISDLHLGLLTECDLCKASNYSTTLCTHKHTHLYNYLYNKFMNQKRTTSFFKDVLTCGIVHIPLPFTLIQIPVQLSEGCGQFNSNSISWTESEPIQLWILPEFCLPCNTLTKNSPITCTLLVKFYRI